MPPVRSLTTALVLLAIVGAAHAQEALPVLSMQVRAEGRAPPAVADTISAVLRADLVRGGRATPALAPSGALNGVAAMPDFVGLSTGGARYALAVNVAQRPDGRIAIAFRSFDVAARTQLEGFQYLSTPENARRMAHRIADRMQQILGGGADFDSRLVAIAGRGDGARVTIMDSDGANRMLLTRAGAHTQAHFIANEFVIYTEGRRLMLYNLLTGRTETLAPRGDIIPEAGVAATRAAGYFAYARPGEGGPDLQVEYLRDRRVLRVLRLAGWQGEPSFSSDGQRLAFLSEQGGARRVMITAREGGDAVAVGQPGQYARLAWSPDGAHLALVRRNQARDELVVMRADGAGDPRMLASAAAFDRPSWSPSGALILVSGEGGVSLIDVATGRRTPLELGVRDLSAVSWSALLP